MTSMSISMPHAGCDPGTTTKGGLEALQPSMCARTPECATLAHGTMGSSNSNETKGREVGNKYITLNLSVAINKNKVRGGRIPLWGGVWVFVARALVSHLILGWFFPYEGDVSILSIMSVILPLLNH